MASNKIQKYTLYIYTSIYKFYESGLMSKHYAKMQTYSLNETFKESSKKFYTQSFITLIGFLTFVIDFQGTN